MKNIHLGSAIFCACATVASGAAPPEAAVTPSDSAAPLNESASPAETMVATGVPGSDEISAMPDCCTIEALTPVLIEIREPLNSRSSERGDRFEIALAEPIIIAGTVVVPAGTPGVGEVIHSAGSGAAGRAGELILAARYLEYQGIRIPLRSFRFGETGRDNQALATGVAIAAGVFSFLVSGGNADVPAGARGDAMIRSDTLITVDPRSEDVGLPNAASETPTTTDAAMEPAQDGQIAIEETQE